jgi:beta-N-acetylhexosaminidase
MTWLNPHSALFGPRPLPGRQLLKIAACSLLCAVVWATAAEAKSRHTSAHKVHHHAKTKAAANRRKPAERTIVLAARSPVAGDASTPANPVPVLTREALLGSDAERLTRIGRHIIVGYHSFADIKALVEKKAIAGIFITDHNVKGRTAADVKAEIDTLQRLRAEQGMPPLIIAADQEGGLVSRLSPPLKKQPSLARTLADLKDDTARQKAVEAYAEDQAAELSRIGVTLNFAPVVDLKLDPTWRNDGETRLRLRAIAADPYLVAKVAGWYCDVLAKSNLMCTLKHFPGLGRVKRDTHVASGAVAASEGQLELNDWVPFRRLMDRPNVATMLGHVRVSALDTTTPASFSHTIISRLIRTTWQHDGLLITDDFSMGAVTGCKDGIGGAAVKALDAGADLILVSFIEKHLDSVMSALLDADAKGQINPKTRDESGERVAHILRQTHQE